MWQCGKRGQIAIGNLNRWIQKIDAIYIAATPVSQEVEHGSQAILIVVMESSSDLEDCANCLALFTAPLTNVGIGCKRDT